MDLRTKLYKIENGDMFSERQSLAYFRARDMLNNMNSKMLTDMVNDEFIYAADEYSAIKAISETSAKCLDVLKDVAQAAETQYSGAEALRKATFDSPKWVVANCGDLIKEAIALGKEIEAFKSAIYIYRDWLRSRITRCQIHAGRFYAGNGHNILFTPKWYYKASVKRRMNDLNDIISMANAVMFNKEIVDEWKHRTDETMGFNYWWMEVINPIIFAIFASCRLHQFPLGKVMDIILSTLREKDPKADSMPTIAQAAYERHCLAAHDYAMYLYAYNRRNYEDRNYPNGLPCPTKYRNMFMDSGECIADFAKNTIAELGEMIGIKDM